jgi:hypothetical protein
MGFPWAGAAEVKFQDGIGGDVIGQIHLFPGIAGEG